jgi:WhiB family redox-sensing transcriptional regulator
MSLTLQQQDWRSQGACLSADPDLFFPISTTGSAAAQVAEAKAVCARCAVRTQCAGYALEHLDVQGIWGGTTDDERRKLRRSRARSSATRARSTTDRQAGSRRRSAA